MVRIEQDQHVASALADVRAKLEAAGEGGDYSFNGDNTEDAGGDVSGGLAALAAAMKDGSGEEEKKDDEKTRAILRADGPTREDLVLRSIKELREMCKSKGLDYSSCIDKHDVIDLIISNPNSAVVCTPSAAAVPVQAPAAGMSAAQMEHAKKMMENPAMMNNALNMMKGMDPATLANMFNMRDGGNNWTPEMAKSHIDMIQQPGAMEQAAAQMKNMTLQQMADATRQGAAAVANGGIVPPGQSTMPNLRAPYQPAVQRSAPPTTGRIDSDDMRRALTTPAPAAAAPGMPTMNPQLQAQMDMMKNNPGMMKQSMDMMRNMDPDTMAKMLESQSAMTGMKVTPEMAKMSANMMKNMDPAQMEKMMSMAGSMGMGGGMPGMGGAHAGAAGGAAAQRGEAPGSAAGGMPTMQMDPATGMPIVTPELQKQMSSMMRDPEMRKNISSMMKNMDPEMLKTMGITDKAQIEKAAQAMESMSPETVDRLMGVAVWGQKAYIFYKTHLWFRCLLQLSLMYMLYWMFGGWTMCAIGFFTGSSFSPAAPDSSAASAGGRVNAGEGAGQRDWSGKASAPIMDDDEVS